MHDPFVFRWAALILIDGIQRQNRHKNTQAIDMWYMARYICDRIVAKVSQSDVNVFVYFTCKERRYDNMHWAKIEYTDWIRIMSKWCALILQSSLCIYLVFTSFAHLFARSFPFTPSLLSVSSFSISLFCLSIHLVSIFICSMCRACCANTCECVFVFVFDVMWCVLYRVL